MASAMRKKTTSLLIFISILQGTHSVSIENKTEVNAAPGQNISLPCIMSENTTQIIQLQWHKDSEHREQKLVVYNPAFSPNYFVNGIELEVVRERNNRRLRGSILHLLEVTEKDSGTYVCEFASFPGGSIKTSTKVKVTVPKVSVNVTSPQRTIVEGDTVSITCISHPPPDNYILFSLNQSIMESQNGKFVIQNITRHVSGLICQPLWNSSNQILQHLKATVNLTVEFLDNIECNSESQIQIETGTNLTITCRAISSKSLDFVWMKDNITVSSSTSISLWAVSKDQSGVYTLNVHAGNHTHLQRQKNFSVIVMNRTSMEHLSSTISMETTTQISSTTMTTPKPSTTMPTSQPQHTNSTEEVMYISTSAPSTGNITVVQLEITTSHTTTSSSEEDRRTLSELCCTYISGSTSREINYEHPDASTIIFTSASIRNITVLINNVVTKVDGSTNNSHVVFIIIPVLLVLLLIAILYRQYLIQKRLDMPPPFKPPPPPVKYTSARNHDIPVTVILV